ncbi:MAG: hypothetical protein KYX64_03650 [Sphingopyxis sp.]|jgi:hypothetical protein|nr:hypothetical protein [Sphingopyxis sp.]
MRRYPVTLRRARYLVRRLARNVRGAVIIEMAFTIPLLVLLGLGGLEMANLTLVSTRVSQLGLSVADNASRIAAGSNLTLPQVRESDINDVFAALDQQAKNLNFKDNGRVILSSLERNADGGQTIKWQRCYGKLAINSAYGAEGKGATGTSFAGMGPAGQEVKAASGTAVMFVEIAYDYQPLVYGKVVGTPRIQSTAAFNVRETRDFTKVYPTGVKSSCA